MDFGYSENHRGKIKSYRKSKHGSLKKSGEFRTRVSQEPVHRHRSSFAPLPLSLCTHGAINGAAVPYGPPVCPLR